MRTDIRPREPLVSSIEPHEAWYWQDSDGKLNIVLVRQGRALFNKNLDFSWVMSFSLDDMPAGREKLYRVDGRTIRLTQSFGGNHGRAKSVAGTIVIERIHGKVLRGRFHVWVRQQQFTVLSGWGPAFPRAPMAIMVGSFEARPDSGKGKPLLDQTEADGFDRASDAPVTTRGAGRLVPATTTSPQ